MKQRSIGDRAFAFSEALAPALGNAASLASGAQDFADRFFEAFRDLTVLVRVFVTVAAKDLPPDDRLLLRRVATDQQLEITGDDTMLALVGTHGIDAAWNDRKTSRDHRVIPLLSKALVDEAPMISGLLGQLGFSNADTRADWQYLKRASDGSGMFFVGDARTATDARGRSIIPAADFVRRHSVKTVFGFGEIIRQQRSLLAMVVFCNRAILREDAMRFAPLAGILSASASEAIESELLFGIG